MNSALDGAGQPLALLRGRERGDKAVMIEGEKVSAQRRFDLPCHASRASVMAAADRACSRLAAKRTHVVRFVSRASRRCAGLRWRAYVLKVGRRKAAMGT